MNGTPHEGTGRAHGKVILVGEHAVVYGRPAIAAALPQGASARARFTDDTDSVLSVEPWHVEVRPRDDSPLARAFAVMLDAVGIERPVRIDAVLELPGGSGLGSSAALGCAVLRALDALVGVESRSAEMAHGITLAWERIFHGRPSGVDNAIAWRGGLIWYVRGHPLEPIRARRPLQLVIGDSGEPCSTRITVTEVARRYERERDRMEKNFEAIAAIVRNARMAMEAGDLRALGQLFDLNHSLLASMLVSTTSLEDMIAAAREAGALGAKLTGGGGGGCMIALVPDPQTAARVRDALTALGKRAFIATIGGTPEAEE
jgi:mevalonate kinase